MITAVGGYPGSGKTTFIKADERLSKFVFLDIYDVYKAYPGIHYVDAMTYLSSQVLQLLKMDPNKNIVVEAKFTPGNYQCAMLETVAGLFDLIVEYIYMDTPLQVCFERVQKDYAEELSKAKTKEEKHEIDRYFTARLDILRRDMPYHL